MTAGAWRRWADHPACEELPSRLGSRSAQLWDGLRDWLRLSYGLEGDVTWTDEDAGWVLRYRAGGRPLVTLFPTADGRFSALVVVGPSLWGSIENLDLSQRTWEAFTFATPYADGRWLWLHVVDAASARDVCRLVALKRPPQRPAPRPTRRVVTDREGVPVA